LDAGIALCVVGLGLLLRDKRFPYRFAAAGILPLLVWLTMLYSRFGRVVPATLAAKQVEGVAAGSYDLAEWMWFRETMSVTGCVAILGLAAVGIVELVKTGGGRQPVVVVFGMYLVLIELAYRLIGVPFAPWYHVGLFNAFLFLAVRGAVAAVVWGLVLVHRCAQSPLLTIVLVGVILAPVWGPGVLYVRRQWRTPPDPRTGAYAVIGTYLRRHSTPESVVAAVEIGALGYTSQRPILDLMGLVSPEALAFRSQSGLATLLIARQPCFVLDVPIFRPTVLQGLADDRIRLRYRPATTFPAYPWSTKGPALLELEPPYDKKCGRPFNTSQPTR
jgi:hypothetical protein